jgi:hypothetical protein
MAPKQPVILNDAGQPIVLNAVEQKRADYAQRQLNALGYEIQITTLTTIMKRISEQKFFEIPPADYLPVRVGEGAWSTNLTTYRSFDIAPVFEDGVVNTGGQNSRLSQADAGVDALNIQVFNWAKAIGWSIMDLEFASKSGNWDVVTAKEKSRKRNWDLGIQQVAFLGMNGQNGPGGACVGLLNQSGITTNTTEITGYINQYSVAQLKTFCATILEVYRSNVNRTAWPTHFVVPESEYNGLASQASADFPIKSTLQLLEEMFQVITRNKSFKILPCAYADPAYHTTVSQIANLHVYALYRYDEESLRMDIPVDYTNTLANSLDNFSFQNAAYGQFTGALAYRPLELMYFVW